MRKIALVILMLMSTAAWAEKVISFGATIEGAKECSRVITSLRDEGKVINSLSTTNSWYGRHPIGPGGTVILSSPLRGMDMLFTKDKAIDIQCQGGGFTRNAYGELVPNAPTTEQRLVVYTRDEWEKIYLAHLDKEWAQIEADRKTRTDKIKQYGL